MKITLYPVLESKELIVSVSGEKITINGELIDLSVIPNGYRLPANAVDNEWMVSGSYIERDADGEMSIELRFPVLWDTPESVRAPKVPTTIVAVEGPVKFPDTAPLKPADEEVKDAGPIQAS